MKTYAIFVHRLHDIKTRRKVEHERRNELRFRVREHQGEDCFGLLHVDIHHFHLGCSCAREVEHVRKDLRGRGEQSAVDREANMTVGDRDQLGSAV